MLFRLDRPVIGKISERFHYICYFFTGKRAERAKELLEEMHIRVVKINNVVIQKLRQDVPGQLGLFCRRLANAGVNILAQYSDHANQLVVVVDDYEKAKQVSVAWMQEWFPER